MKDKPYLVAEQFRSSFSSKIYPALAPWLLWFSVCVLVSALLIPNLTLWPRITQDEAQIIELGRVFLNPDTEWSAGWLVHDSLPKTTTSYIGVVIQEWAYNLFSPSNVGSRLSALVGALVAASVVFGWLWSRRTPKWLALVLALVFLLDPIFNESYRQGRVDSWAFAVCIAACWLLRAGLNQHELQRSPGLHLVFAGALSGVAYFVWPTTLALMPLVLLELYYVVASVWRQHQERRFFHVFKSLSLFSAGGFAAVIVCLIPVLADWESHLSSVSQGFHIQQVASQFQKSIIDLYMLYDPMIIIGLLVSLTFRRETGLIIAFVIALLMMHQTMVYKMRILYLLPYFVAIFAGACATLPVKDIGSYRKLALYSAISLLLFWGVSVSLVKRPVLAIYQKEARSPEQIQMVLSELVGAGPHRVLMSQWSVYFAARALEWNYYKVFGRYYKWSDDFRDFLESLDYVILSEKYFWANETTPEQLKLANFELVSTISFKSPDSEHFSILGIRLLAPDEIYEDILVYRRTVSEP
jgi:hypothetical protein